MKPILLTCAIMLAMTAATHADVTASGANDVALQAAITKAIPNPAEAPTILKTDWNAKPVAFVDYAVKAPLKQQPDYETTTVYLTAFVKAQESYTPLRVDTFEEDGGTAEIRAIGFANADKDAAKELIVIAAWPFHSADNEGTFYEVRLYDDTGTAASGALRPLTNVTKHFGLECDCNGKTARFKTIAAVKKELTRIGY